MKTIKTIVGWPKDKDKYGFQLVGVKKGHLKKHIPSQKKRIGTADRKGEQ